MLQRLGKLRGWSIAATDGDIGKVSDFYFDDERWVIRYLLADTGGWLTSRRVLISPMSFRGIERDAERFHVSLTKSQVEKSPDAGPRGPISRGYEATYLNYYGYPYYWGGAALWGGEPYPAGLARANAPGRIEAAQFSESDVHLKSVSEVSGYHIRALDGEIGHVDDFLTDSESWAIRYLIVDTSNFIGGKTVLLAPDWARRVEWESLTVHVDLDKEQVKNSPEYDPNRPIDREYEERLHGYYRRPIYWER